MKSSAQGKSHEHKQDKEDHLAPTNIGQDNKPDKDQGKGANLTHGELQNRLNLYSRIGGQMEQSFKVQAIKQKYLKEIKEKEVNRSKSDIHYGQGIRTGLPHTRHEILRDQRDRSDQKLRDDVAKEAKSYYSQNNSLSKYFRDYKHQKEGMNRAFEKARDKGIDRER
ncbi:hypothetical protein QQ020_23400 [Fulvivirgaceae bacterium BMA12]|uniref:Uncharacterized protein n=1 Tax=Agaribacillus aureus TaxID=3051825 RepID=A0ABT8LBC2_9BACT|nr:hypothetical protein [Fulvivirgaceae bacterium BMA12]